MPFLKEVFQVSFLEAPRTVSNGVVAPARLFRRFGHSRSRPDLQLRPEPGTVAAPVAVGYRGPTERGRPTRLGRVLIARWARVAFPERVEQLSGSNRQDRPSVARESRLKGIGSLLAPTGKTRCSTGGGFGIRARPGAGPRPRLVMRPCGAALTPKLRTGDTGGAASRSRRDLRGRRRFNLRVSSPANHVRKVKAEQEGDGKEPPCGDLQSDGKGP